MLAATNRPGDPRPRAAAPGPLRPPGRRQPARRGGPRARSSRCTPAHVPLAPDVDLDVARRRATPGMVGADLKNLVNEAALTRRAARPRAGRASPTSPTRWRRSSSAPSAASCSRREERERTAYHESGHALLGMLTPGADPVRKVSIIPRGRALGVTFQRPTPTATATTSRTCGAASSARSAAGPPRRSSTATSLPAPSPTSSRSRGSPGRWSAAGACRRRSAWSRCCRGPQDEPLLFPGQGPGGPSEDPSADRLRGPPDRRGLLRRGEGDHHRASRQAGVAGEGPARARDARRGRRVRRRRRPARPQSAGRTNPAAVWPYRQLRPTRAATRHSPTARGSRPCASRGRRSARCRRRSPGPAGRPRPPGRAPRQGRSWRRAAPRRTTGAAGCRPGSSPRASTPPARSRG